jgi:hypothetical protein
VLGVLGVAQERDKEGSVGETGVTLGRDGARLVRPFDLDVDGTCPVVLPCSVRVPGCGVRGGGGGQGPPPMALCSLCPEALCWLAGLLLFSSPHFVHLSL